MERRAPIESRELPLGRVGRKDLVVGDTRRFRLIQRCTLGNQVKKKKQDSVVSRWITAARK